MRAKRRLSSAAGKLCGRFSWEEPNQTDNVSPLVYFLYYAGFCLCGIEVDHLRTTSSINPRADAAPKRPMTSCQAHAPGRTPRAGGDARRTARCAVPRAGSGHGPLSSDLTRGLPRSTCSRLGPGQQGCHDSVKAAGCHVLPLWARPPPA